MEDDSSLYAGLAGAELSVDSFEFGEGINISKTYAHLMASFILASSRPECPEQPHPGPWKRITGGLEFDILAQLEIPDSFKLPKWFSHLDTVWWFVALLRVSITPNISVPVLATESFSKARGTEDKIAFLLVEIESPLLPIEIEIDRGISIQEEGLVWIRENWISGGYLVLESAEFGLLMRAIDNCFGHSSKALGLISLWGALEALFSPSPSELRFRVAANIAAFLEPPGDGRWNLQKGIAKLYDARSAAAHGRSESAEKPLLDTYLLAKRIVMKILGQRRVPKIDELEARLFGVE
jgi:hypothetical protein